MLRQAFVQHAHVGMHDLVGMQLPHARAYTAPFLGSGGLLFSMLACMLWRAFGQHAHVGMHAPAGMWACMLRRAFVQHAHVGMRDLVGGDAAAT